jgi:hypothetical protein
MEIEAEITGLDEIVVDLVGDPVRTRTVLLSREGTIEVSLVYRQIPLLCDEALHVQYGETDERPTDIRVVPFLGNLSDNFDTVEFVTVNRSREERGRARSRAVDNRDRNANRIAEIRLTYWKPEFLGFARINPTAVERERLNLLIGHHSPDDGPYRNKSKEGV